jgi:hypothetical protein
MRYVSACRSIVPTLTLLTALSAAALTVGCGSSSSTTTDDAAPFAGAWSFNPGTAACATGISFPITGLAVTVTEVSKTMITLSAGSTCAINFTVSGATATAAAGQSCTLATPAGAQTIMVSSWTLAISGAQITNTAAGTATICGGGITVTGTLVKGTADSGSAG